ncbi:alpha/beta fold hydrolase [Desemzia incerta]|uniref:alpha/beta fold hydrolase n=1 Tax=Desemzia incerta TaxID=82801 RepID=UPI0024C4556D|nr:alpha/beta fold hydrolase [Desemzia incerta]WHZ32022.1 alpha/beta fold hydrolase [Desemzia incerta]
MKLTIRKRTLGTIPMLEVVPTKKRNDLLPLIVYYHGWQSVKELNLTQARYLARQGFRVILPDAMNHGERKQPVSKIPSLTFWQSIHTNLVEFGFIVHHFRTIGFVDDVIGVGGTSMGGITTCALLTHHPEIKAAACLMGSPKLSAYRERIVEHAKWSNRYLPQDYKELLSWIPQYDLSLHPETLDGRPLFIWHGKQDLIVPYEDVADFADQQKELPNIYFTDEDEEHLVKTSTMREVTDFFVKELLEK